VLGSFSRMTAIIKMNYECCGAARANDLRHEAENRDV